MEKREAWGPGSAARHGLCLRLRRLLRQRSDGPGSGVAAPLSPRTQGFRLGGFVVFKQRMGKGKEVHVLSLKAVCGSGRWAERA